MDNRSVESPVVRGSERKSRRFNGATQVKNGWSRSPDLADLMRIHGQRKISVPRPESGFENLEEKSAQ